MITINFNRNFETEKEVNVAIEKAIETNEDVISCNFDGEAFVTHYLDDEIIDWSVDAVYYNEDGSVKNIDLDC